MQDSFNLFMYVRAILIVGTLNRNEIYPPVCACKVIKHFTSPSL